MPPCTWLAALATASLFAFALFPLIAGVPSPSHSPSSPWFPWTCRHESPAMSGSQLGAATSTHCRRDEETGNTIPMNRGKAGKEPTLVGPCRGLKRQRVCSASKRQRVPQRVCSASVLGEAQNKACYCPCFRYAFVSYSEKLKPKWT